jgi:hypothetical protein
MSGLSDYLVQILHPLPTIGLYPSIYGDAIMPLKPKLQGYIRNGDAVEQIRNR